MTYNYYHVIAERAVSSHSGYMYMYTSWLACAVTALPGQDCCQLQQADGLASHPAVTQGRRVPPGPAHPPPTIYPPIAHKGSAVTRFSTICIGVNHNEPVGTVCTHQTGVRRSDQVDIIYSDKQYK